MLKTSGNIESITQPGKSVVKVSSDSKARHNRSKVDVSGIGNNKVDDEGDNEVRKKS